MIVSAINSDNRHRQVAWWAHHSGNTDEVLQGVLGFVSEHPNWNLCQQLELPDEQWAAWKGDGILACGNLKPIAHLIEQLQIPIVMIFSNPDFPAMPVVDDDQAAVGTLAAEHLLERGLRNFAFYGYEGIRHSDERREAFVGRLQQAGFPCAVFFDANFSAKPLPTDAIAQWLATLPKPVGVMGVSAFRGRQILSACRRLGVAVPEQIAVITAKWDCDESPLDVPQLSYVRLNGKRLGYEAAALLDRYMAGSTNAPGAIHRFAPQGVETRQSTDLCAVPDAHVAEALRYIRQHACEGIQVKEVLLNVPQSRRGFNARFQKIVGRTPHEEIVRVRMNLVKQLLTETDLQMKQIAARCGFKCVENLNSAFRRVMKMPPKMYRIQHGRYRDQLVRVTHLKQQYRH